MVIIENEILKVSINTKGALLTSINDKRNDEELLYQIEKDSWPFQDVQIFPIIGATNYRVKDFKLSSPTRHGFIRNMEFKVINKTNETATLKINSNEETKKLYPYDFEFFITYSLKFDKLTITTKILNLSNETLLCMYGAHTAIKANENAILNLGKGYTQYKLIDGLISEKGTLIDDNKIQLTKDYFKKEDTIVIDNTFDKLIIKNGFNHDVIYTFDAPLFALWSRNDTGNFVCLEPWWGISNVTNEEIELKDTKFINEIKKEKEFTYSLTFQLN